MDDVARYLAFLTGLPEDPATRARYDAVLPRATLREMWAPIAKTGTTLPEFASVGLGFFSLDRNGRRIVGHTGDQAGYRSYIYLDPASSSAVILVFNTSNDDRSDGPEMAALAAQAIDALRP